MSWELFDEEYNEVASFQGVSDNSTDELVVCLPEGCYLIQAYDSYGDGWNGGAIEIAYDEEVVNFAMASVAEDYLTLALYTENCLFELLGCTDPTAVNYSSSATVDDGSCIFDTEFVINDTIRTYIYYEPENIYPGAPLLFALHGWTGSAQAIMEYSGLNALADEHGFAVCYPQGLLDEDGFTHWNAGLEISTVGDLEYLIELANFLQETHDLSSECTFSCGFSNGGFMGYHMACEASEVFRGIVSVNGAMSAHDWLNCDPSSPVSIMEIHGTADLEVPYTGMPDIGGGWGPSGSSPEIIDFWVEENQCTSSESFDFPNSSLEDGTLTDMVKHSGGLEGSQVWFYTVTNGPHDWPGWYGAETDMNASQEIWDFMEQLCATSVSIEEPTSRFELQVYPNPASSMVSIRPPNGPATATHCEVRIYDNAMKLVQTSNALTFDVSNLSVGLYFLSIHFDEQQFTKKLVVE